MPTQRAKINGSVNVGYPSPKFRGKFFWSRGLTDSIMQLSTHGSLSPCFCLSKRSIFPVVMCIGFWALPINTQTKQKLRANQMFSQGLGPSPENFRSMQTIWPLIRHVRLFGVRFNEPSYCPKTIAKVPRRHRGDYHMCMPHITKSSECRSNGSCE